MSAGNLLFVLFFYFAITFCVHLLYAFGPYRMAKHAGVPHAWVGLLPIGAGWLLGLLAERSLYAGTGRRSRLSVWTPLMQGIAFLGLGLVIYLIAIDSDFNGLVAFAAIAILVGSVAGTIFFFYSLYQVFRDYAPDNAVLYTILGILFNIYFIFLLVEMNTVPESVTGPGNFRNGRPKYDSNHQWNAAPPQYGYSQGYGAYPPPQGGPSFTSQGYTYSPAPGQQPPQTPYGGNQAQPPQPPYGGNQNQQPYSGQGPQFYQGSGYYQPQQSSQPFDPSRNFPGGGYDPKHPDTFNPSEPPRDKNQPNNGPEL